MAVLSLMNTVEGDIISHAIIFSGVSLYVLYILTFEGYIYRRLNENKLLQIVLAAQFFQLGICINENLWYNHGDTTADQVVFSLAFASQSCYNVILYILCFYESYNKGSGMKILIGIMAVICLSVWISQIAFGGIHPSLYLRLMFAPYYLISWIIGIVVYIRLYLAFKNKKIKLVNTKQASYDETKRILLILIPLWIIGVTGFIGVILLGMLRVGALASHGCMTISAIVVQRMDFIQKYKVMVNLDGDDGDGDDQQNATDGEENNLI